MSTHRLLIKGACVITLDPEVGDFPKADVMVEDDRIAAVAPELDVTDADVIDGTYRVVIPGFVDAHRHTWQTTMRNLNSDMTFFEYFTELLPAIGIIHRPEDMYAGTLLGAIEALDAGVTTLVDFGININTPEHSDAIVEALLETRMRGFYGHGVPSDLSWWQDSDRDHPRDAERVKSRWFSSDDALVRFAIALRGPERVTPRANKADFAFARELGARIILHVDAPGAIEGMAGYLGDDSVYTHCCRSTDRDFELIKESGGYVNVTPECEMGLHNEPITGKALAHGLRPSLGVDGAGTISADMFVQMRMALQQERMRILHESWEAEGRSPYRFPVNTRDALEWATIEGARAMGIDHLTGTLTPGKQADIVIIRADSPQMTPMNHPVAAVVQTATARDVDTVLVAGRALKRDGQLVGVDVDRVRRLVIETRDHLFAAGGVPPSSALMPTSWPVPGAAQ